MRGSSSIGDSLSIGVSAQTTAITLSGWSGEIRGEIAVKLSLAALPLRTRPDFETSRALCGLAQNSAHSELTPNFAAQAADNLLSTKYNHHHPTTTVFLQKAGNSGTLSAVFKISGETENEQDASNRSKFGRPLFDLVT
ncbi:hypothetical protein ACFQHW_04510 [Lapidilactobacillus achengensis]|uniref:Uncharacterized protein n=1 Tax=Lapidilactobacillus achengensis TaxID=2486000 RepID=A0ABW1UPR3_9LACO|nr:hypothetical protein [Lapidilactobacillus achengensis]